VITAEDGYFNADGLLVDTEYWVKQYALHGYAFTTSPIVIVKFPSGSAQRHAEVLFGNMLRVRYKLYIPVLLGGS
jgi:hypothetical protein